MKTAAAMIVIALTGTAQAQDPAEIGRNITLQCAYADGASQVCLSRQEASAVRFRCTEFERVFRFMDPNEYGDMVKLAQESIRRNGGDCARVKEHAEKVSLFALSKVMGY